MMTGDLPVVRVEGGARGRGRRVGEELAEPIHRSLSFYRGYLERRGLSAGDLLAVLRPYREAASRALPSLVEELDGMAEGSGADPWELFAVNAFEELEPALEGGPLGRCTAFVATGPAGTILAHNEQWYAGDVGNSAVVMARPDDGVAFASVTVASMLPAVGLNAAGIGQSIMSLQARDDGVGVPRVPVSRHSLQATDPRDAAMRTDVPGRAGGYAHLFAFAGGQALTVETTATRHRVLEGAGAHTNHYLSPDLAAAAPGPSEGSAGRLARLRSLLEEGPATVERAIDVLRDHGPPGRALCVHPDPDAGDEAEAVLFSMVCHLEERQMWVAPGNPCVTDFVEILADWPGGP